LEEQRPTPTLTKLLSHLRFKEIGGESDAISEIAGDSGRLR
jgi:hypothetical protein